MTVMLRDTPPDPTWRTAPPPGGTLLFVDWAAAPDADGAVPDAVAAALAEAVAAGGGVVFLGSAPDTGGACTPAPAATGWTEAGAGTWTAQHPAPRPLRRSGMPRLIRLTATADGAVARELFRQAGFSWQLRGQIGFLVTLPDLPEPGAILQAGHADPPTLPPRTVGWLRPGTDGGFAECAVIDPRRRAALIAALAARRA